MKTTSIKLSELDEYLKIVKMERDLQITMTIYNEDQEVQLRRLEKINQLAKHLSAFKPKYKDWFKQASPEVQKKIKQIGRGY